MLYCAPWCGRGNLLKSIIALQAIQSPEKSYIPSNRNAHTIDTHFMHQKYILPNGKLDTLVNQKIWYDVKGLWWKRKQQRRRWQQHFDSDEELTNTIKSSNFLASDYTNLGGCVQIKRENIWKTFKNVKQINVSFDFSPAPSLSLAIFIHFSSKLRQVRRRIYFHSHR